MPTLVNRIATAAKAFATQLGDTLATTLQSFQTSWQQSRDAQQQQMGAVGGNRTQRTSAETGLELALTTTMHTVATIFPGNVVQCSSYFDFSLLYSQAHPHKSEILNGNVSKSSIAAVLNPSFTAKTHLKLTNNSDNALLLIYLAPTADAQPNGKGIEVDAGKSRNLELSELGDDNDTFLIIKNLSDVNDAAYTLEIKG